MTTEEIARVAHQVNRAYCLALGDGSQVSWEQAPDWQKKSAISGVNLHSDGKVGPQASHENWMKEKTEAGWVYGVDKDEQKKTHPCMLPFLELPVAQQAKDFIFRAVVHALAH